ncbi:putative toxin-antitoxin system antitoxin component (TIGR02293 family) [Paraburkholderia youngii]
MLLLARVLARAAEVFEDLELALSWLQTPAAVLEGATPLSLLSTDDGAERVMDALGRIEHGVFD